MGTVASAAVSLYSLIWATACRYCVLAVTTCRYCVLAVGETHQLPLTVNERNKSATLIVSARSISWIGLRILQPRRAAPSELIKHHGTAAATCQGLWAWTEADGPPGPTRPNRAVTAGAEGIPGTAAAS